MTPAPKQAKKKQLSFHKMIPNMITLAAMASGITSVKFAIAGKWEAAVLAIVAATFMDAFDGAAARLLKASSKLGAELDSLSDFVAFGVAPALVVYLWTLENLGRWGWFIALVYTMALALRLARFNVTKEEEEGPACNTESHLGKYFTGVPAPVDAGLCILPMIITFLIKDYTFSGADLVRAPLAVGLWALFVAALAISPIPTFSSKQIRIPYRLRIIAMGGFALLIAALINDPWPTLTLMGFIYLCTLPLGFLHYRRARRRLSRGEVLHDDHDDE